MSVISFTAARTVWLGCMCLMHQSVSVSGGLA